MDQREGFLECVEEFWGQHWVSDYKPGGKDHREFTWPSAVPAGKSMCARKCDW